jgi:hypothetical protein
MEEYLLKAYATLYSAEFHFDHVYPTRSLPTDHALFQARYLLITQQLAPLKYRKASLQKKPPASAAASDNKENEYVTGVVDEYKPFNIAEMEVQVSGFQSAEQKQEELVKLYQSMGLLY